MMIGYRGSTCIVWFSVLIATIFMIVASEAKNHTVCTKNDWIKFKKAYGKHYSNKNEDAIRRNIFCTNFVHIQRHNAKSAKEDGFQLGINHMSDWNDTEIENTLGYDHRPELEKMMGDTATKVSIREDIFTNFSNETVPNQIDWRNKPNRVGPIHNQGICGACWAFVTVGLLEGQQALRTTERLVPLSAQDLIDCDPREGGCEGGVSYRALYYINEAGGIQTEKDYPFVSNKTGTAGHCHFDKTKAHPSTTTVKGPVFLKTNDEENLKQVVANYGPVAVALEATWSFFQYRKGIFYEEKPRTGRLNHEVLLIGYGTTNSGDDYWVIKNSWGIEWGESGFGKIARNRGNHCGIQDMPIIFK